MGIESKEREPEKKQKQKKKKKKKKKPGTNWKKMKSSTKKKS